jgi:SatD family (SatD)
MMSDRTLATLIGDVVHSRDHGDRRRLQRSVSGILDWANAWTAPTQSLETSIGDEFQGGFTSVAAAAQASLLVRLKLLVDEPGADCRFGLGHGVVSVFDATRSPVSQDGPGWWSAREAILRAKTLADNPRTSFVRTCFVSGVGPEDHAAMVESFLFSRDAMVDRMTARQRRLLLGTLLGRTQADLAVDEGITQSAVSQALRRGGAFGVEAAQLRLGEGDG